MKSPFAVIGFSFFASLIAGNFLGIDIGFYLLIFFLIVAVVTSFFVKKIKYIVAAFWSAFIAMLVFCLCYTAVVVPATKIVGERGKISGVITDCREYGSIYSYTLKVDKSEFTETHFNLEIKSNKYLSDDNYHRLSCTVEEIKLVSTNESSGVYLSAYLDSDMEYNVSDESEFSLQSLAYRANKALSSNINKAVPARAAQLMEALFLGNVKGSALKTAFRYVGGSHILVISGIHFTIISSALILLLKRLRLKKLLIFILSVSFVLSYMFISGTGSSVMRAGILIIVLRLGELIGAEYSSINSLGFAVLIICAINPLGAASAGLILSIAACLGIVLLTDNICEKLVGKSQSRLKKIIMDPIAVAIGATVFTVPISIMFFNEFSLITVITSMILTLPISIIIILAMLTSLIAFIYLPLTLPLAFLGTVISSAVLFYVESMPQYFLFSLGDLSGLVAISLFVMLGFIVIFRSKRIKLAAVALSAVILISCIGMNYYYFKDTVRVSVGPGRNGFTVVIFDGINSTCFYSGYKSYELVYTALDKGSGFSYEERSWKNAKSILGTEYIDENVIRLDLNGCKLLFSKSKYYEDKCDIYISQNPSSLVSSAFTIIPQNAIMAETENLPAGNYIYTENVLIFDVLADGSIKIIEQIEGEA